MRGDGPHPSGRDDVPVHVRSPNRVSRAEHVRRRRHRPEGDRDPAPPIPGRRHRRPADVVIVVITRPPDHPRRGIDAAWDPRPTTPGNPNPSPVVEGGPAPVVIADPEPLVAARQSPMPGGHVGGKVIADDVCVGDPDRAVRPILGPGAIRREHVLKFGHSARVLIQGEIVVGGRALRRRAHRDLDASPLRSSLDGDVFDHVLVVEEVDVVFGHR